MSVADILQQLAQNAGRARPSRASVIGNTIADLSQLPGQIMDDRARQQVIDQQRARQQGQDARQARGDARDEATFQAEQRDKAAADAIMTAYTAGSPNDPTTNNLEAGLAKAKELGYPQWDKKLRDIHAQELLQAQPKLTSGAPGSVMRGPDGKVIAGSEIPVVKPDYTVGDQRFSGADNTVIATGTPKEKVLEPGSFGDYLTTYADEKGLVRKNDVGKGNIPLYGRPVVKNADGSTSTVRSMSFNENGKEILVPTVVGGKVVSDDAAIAEYHKTGKHLGIFKTPAEATAYAAQLHDDYAAGVFDKRLMTAKDIEDARKRYQQADDRPRVDVRVGGASGTGDVKETVAGMKDGTLPPLMPGRASKDYTAIMAEAHRQGYDLQGAVTDWNATQKHVATMNGAQQLRLNQAINSLPEMLDSVDALAAKWKGGRFPILNKANLAAAKGGAYGTDVASVANQLDAQIADVTADLGVVYMGGNSPTDHALGLAGKSLKGEWDEKVLHDMVTLAHKNVTIRSHSMKNTGVAGASATNPYGAQPPAAAAPPAPAGMVRVVGPNGETGSMPSGSALPPGWKKQ